MDRISAEAQVKATDVCKGAHQEAAMPKRKYEVSGTDDLGDVHVFLTDDRQRAEEVRAVMSEDLEEVELNESAAA